MLTATPLSAQIDAQHDDRLRVLIAGAGIAGLTLAALLRRQGLHPVLIERMPQMAHPGYMLALMPMVDAAFDEIGCHDDYVARSTPIATYASRSHRGRLMRSDDFSTLLAMHGEYRGIDRGALLEVLTSDGCSVAFGTTIEAVAQMGSTTDVRFATDESPTEASFDLVVVAEGLNSRTRELLDAGEVSRVDTGWGGWVSWVDPAGVTDLGEEVWGDGFFLGAYPVQGRLGVFLGGSNHDTAVGLPEFAERVRAAAPEMGERLRAVLDGVVASPDPYYWALTDVRAERWVTPGAVLLGDAAAGFLPTAGIGAGMAIESAWTLGRMLRDTDRSTLQPVLEEWERVQKPRVESAQDNSRMLARLMFRRGRLIAWMRETITRMLTVRAVLGPIARLVAAQPDPDAAAQRARVPAP